MFITAPIKMQVNAEGRVVISAKDPSVKEGGAPPAEAGVRRARDADDLAAAAAAADAASSAGQSKRPRVRAPGEEYRAKNAGGDVWKKGMLEPHAYIPLDPRLLNRKNHREAVSTFGAVVSGGKGGGSKARGAAGGGGGSRGHKGAAATGTRKQRRNAREGK